MTSEQFAVVERMRAKGILRADWQAHRHVARGDLLAVPATRDRGSKRALSNRGQGNHVVRRFTLEEDRQIVEMRLAGMSIKVIADAMGRTPVPFSAD